MKLFIINGPNLNMLGIREQGLYGNKSYADLKQFIQKVCEENGVEAEIFQSNHEGAIVDCIQSAYKNANGIIINPAAYTHTSIAILDALKAAALPSVEVHLTDVQNRESFRRVSYAGMACVKTICGKGFEGYREAILFLKETVQRPKV
jgi:3-dehydroquinate dehydratase-2